MVKGRARRDLWRSSKVVLKTGLSLAVTLLCLSPFFILLVLSMAQSWPFPRLLPRDWRPQRWLTFLGGNNAISESFLLSLTISLLVAAICTPLGYLAAKWVAYHPRRHLLLLLAYAPYTFSPVILGTCLMFLYIQLGLVGNVQGVVLAQSMFAAAFAIIFFVPFWNEDKKALEDTIRTLGGNDSQVFRHGLWPISKGMLLICFVQTFLISWTQYGLTLLIGSGKVQTLPIKVFEYVNEANPFFAALAACLLIMPPALLIVINKRYLKQP